jgi:ATP:ADP antiporter, AAA family
MFTRVVQYFYPDLRGDEVKKFGLLSLAFFFTIGAYWMLRLLKDTIFFKIAFPESVGWVAKQGGLWQPYAKMGSVIVVFILVLIYSKLVDLFPKEKLFYIICTFYSVLFFAITGVLLARDMWGDVTIGWLPLYLLGWVSYFAIESFGSIVVALFWSFTASVTDTEAAKRGFPFIIAGAQVGSIGGSALTIFAEQLGGIWRLFLLASIFVVAIMLIIKLFMNTIPAYERSRPEDKVVEKKSPGVIEMLAGFKLLFTRGYLFGILILSTFYEVVGTIVDYQMKRQADVFPAYAGETGFAKFMGIFGVATNTLALLMALLGTSYLMKRFGLTFCLLIYPVCLGTAMTALYLFFAYGNPTAAQLLWSTFAVMMLAKGLSYAVNNPAKEMMYIPTSKDARFKTKGLIDMFGSRTAKMGGASFSNIFKKNLTDLMAYGTLLGLGIVGIWLGFALYVGRKNKQLRDTGQIVE